MKKILLVLIILLTFGVFTNTFAYSPEVVDILIEQVNLERIEYGLQPLRSNPVLTSVATKRANDMAERNYFAHINPDGWKWWMWFYLESYYFRYAGENLARRFINYNDIVPAWMDSPTHRANILSSNFTEIGIAISGDIVVQEFAKPYFTK